MKAKTAKKPAKKPVPLEEDERIVAGTLQGARECKMGLAKRFDKIEDAIAYLRGIDGAVDVRSQAFKVI